MRKLATIVVMLLFAAISNAQSTTTDTTLQEYTGKYNFPAGTIITTAEITIQGSELFVSSSAGSASLAKMGKDTFSIPSYNGMVYFFRTTEGKVNRIRIEVQDMVMEGERENAIAWMRRSSEIWIARR